DNSPKSFNQSALNDLVRDLGLSKESVELLGSRLKERHLLESETTFSWYRYREKEFIPFSMVDSLVFCNNVSDLMHFLGLKSYNANEWRRFIDFSRRNLKVVFLHNGGIYASIPIGHSIHLKETYENLKTLLGYINYEQHNWLICGDLKILCMILGQQQGFTKLLCFLCEWDSRARKLYWTEEKWKVRKILEPGVKNVI
ncbi:hypothetical protein EAI_07091, partial [Harpegnathos saltator]